MSWGPIWRGWTGWRETDSTALIRTSTFLASHYWACSRRLNLCFTTMTNSWTWGWWHHRRICRLTKGFPTLWLCTCMRWAHQLGLLCLGGNRTLFHKRLKTPTKLWTNDMLLCIAVPTWRHRESPKSNIFVLCCKKDKFNRGVIDQITRWTTIIFSKLYNAYNLVDIDNDIVSEYKSMQQ